MPPLLLTDDERAHAASLHVRDAQGEALTPAESELVQRFRTALEADEATSLQPSVERRKRHLEWQQARNRDREALLTRQTALVSRLRAVLLEAEHERATLARERERITATPEPAH